MDAPEESCGDLHFDNQGGVENVSLVLCNGIIFSAF